MDEHHKTTLSSEAAVIEHRAYARVGLLGNPSDVYYGRTISFTAGNFWATVRLQPSDDLVIQPHPTHDLVVFRSLHHLSSGDEEGNGRIWRWTEEVGRSEFKGVKQAS